MTFVSKLAMAAALTLGTSALGVSPALAQKKNDKEQAIKVSDEFRTPAAAAQAAVDAKNWTAAEPSIVAAEAVAKSDTEKYFAAVLRLQLETSRNNVNGQVAALGILASNPTTPAANVKPYQQRFYYLQGAAAANAKKNAEAIQYLTKAREAGSTAEDISILLANAYGATGKNAEAVAEVEKAMAASKAAGRKPPVEWYRFAIPKVSALGDRAATAQWMTRYIQEYPTVQNWRWVVQVTRQGTPAANEKVEKLDLYRLMRSTNALADRGDYADYAYQAQTSGLPWEAVTAIEEGRKNGKIPAGDSDTGRIYTASQAAAKAEGSLDRQVATAKTGTQTANLADAFLASGKNAKALELYDQALQRGGAKADEVNLHRGIALQRLGRKDEARTAFQAVPATGSYGNLALLWATSVDFPPLGA